MVGSLAKCLVPQLAPVLNAVIVWWNIPRVTAAYFHLKRGGETANLPSAVFDTDHEMMEAEGGDKQQHFDWKEVVTW